MIIDTLAQISKSTLDIDEAERRLNALSQELETADVQKVKTIAENILAEGEQNESLFCLSDALLTIDSPKRSRLTTALNRVAQSLLARPEDEASQCQNEVLRPILLHGDEATRILELVQDPSSV